MAPDFPFKYHSMVQLGRKIYPNLCRHNGMNPYISGVHVSRQVQKCKGFMAFFVKLARNKPSKLQKSTTFSDNVPPGPFDPYMRKGPLDIL